MVGTIAFVLPPVAALAFVALYARPSPLTDEWLLLRNAMALREAGSLGQALRAMTFHIYQHIILIPALVHLPVAELANHDSRALILLTWLSFLAILVVIRLRMTTSNLSAAPVALMLFGPGHYMEFLWGFQFTLAFSIAFPVAGLAVLARIGDDGERPGRLLAGMGLILLGLLSSAGAIFAFLATAVLFALRPLPLSRKIALCGLSLAVFASLAAAVPAGQERAGIGLGTALFVLTSLGATLVGSPVSLTAFGIDARSVLGLLICASMGASLLLSWPSAEARGRIALPASLFVFGLATMGGIALSRPYLGNWHLQYALPACCGMYAAAVAAYRGSRDRRHAINLAAATAVALTALWGYAVGFAHYGPSYNAYAGQVEAYMRTYDRAPDAPKPFPETGGWDFDADMQRFLRQRQHPLFTDHAASTPR